MRFGDFEFEFRDFDRRHLRMPRVQINGVTWSDLVAGLGGGAGPTGRVRDLRQSMIAETSEFLSWALRCDWGLPRIPRRRVDDGGFSDLLRMPGARALVIRWWQRALNATDHLR